VCSPPRKVSSRFLLVFFPTAQDSLIFEPFSSFLQFFIDYFCGEDFLLLLVKMVPEQSKNPKRFAIVLDMLTNGIKVKNYRPSFSSSLPRAGE